MSMSSGADIIAANGSGKINENISADAGGGTVVVDANKDEWYCHWTARKAVARAALHLGVEYMDSESLDVVAGCLLEYLSRIASTIAATSEAAGRNSANVLDALSAVELCTSPAAATVHINSRNSVAKEDEEEDGDTKQENDDADMVHGTHVDTTKTSWKDLAIFCFGKNWKEDPTAAAAAVVANASAQRGGGHPRGRSSAASAGGKVGPSTMTEEEEEEKRRENIANGWKAPYPDEVPYFPVCGPHVANPHALLTEPALHATAAAAAAEREEMVQSPEVPDAAVLDWGTLAMADNSQAQDSDKKRKADETNNKDNQQPPTKKIKFAHDTKRDDDSRLTIPIFFPPFPRDDGRTVIDTGTTSTSKATTTTAATTDQRKLQQQQQQQQQPQDALSVRSALVQLGEYWGSYSTELDGVAVDAGRPAAAATTPAASAIVPLTRASGSRVSRILEGSMDQASTNIS